MEENQPTSKQVIAFTVLMSFITSIIGTVLTLGVLGPYSTDNAGGLAIMPAPLKKPKVVEKVTEKVVEKRIEQKVISQEESMSEIMNKISPAVVQVLVRDSTASSTNKYLAKGSGVLISKEGFVLTSKKLLTDKGDKNELIVKLDDNIPVEAKIVVVDKNSDLAVLQIDSKEFSYANLGDPKDMNTGQLLSGLGKDDTGELIASRGIMVHKVAGGEKIIRVDINLYPGILGGPVISLSGKVMGIIQGVDETGAVYAISASHSAKLLDIIREYKTIEPYLGLRYIEINPELAKRWQLTSDYGLLIAKVNNRPAIEPGSPAAKAGIKEGDIIIEVNKIKINTEQDFKKEVEKYYPGENIEFLVRRGKDKFTLQIALEGNQSIE